MSGRAPARDRRRHAGSVRADHGDDLHRRVSACRCERRSTGSRLPRPPCRNRIVATQSSRYRLVADRMMPLRLERFAAVVWPPTFRSALAGEPREVRGYITPGLRTALIGAITALRESGGPPFSRM